MDAQKARKFLIPVAGVLLVGAAINLLLESSVLSGLVASRYSSMGLQLGALSDQVGENAVFSSATFENETLRLDLQEGQVALGKSSDVLFGSDLTIPLVTFAKGELLIKKTFKDNPLLGADIDFSQLNGLRVDLLSVSRLVVKDQSQKEVLSLNDVSLGKMKVDDGSVEIGSLGMRGTKFRLNFNKLSSAKGITQWEKSNLVLEQTGIPLLRAPLVFTVSGKLLSGAPNITLLESRKSIKATLNQDLQANIHFEKLDLSSLLNVQLPITGVFGSIMKIPLVELEKMNITPYVDEFRMNLSEAALTGRRLPAGENSGPNLPVALFKKGTNHFSIKYHFSEVSGTHFVLASDNKWPLKQALAKALFGQSHGGLTGDKLKDFELLFPLFRLDGDTEKVPVVAEKTGVPSSAAELAKVKVAQTPPNVESAPPSSNETQAERSPASMMTPANPTALLESQDNVNPFSQKQTLYPLSFIDAPMFVKPEQETNIYHKQVVQVDDSTEVIVQRNPQGYKILERTFRNGKMIKSVYWSNNDQGKIVLIKEWPETQ